MKDSQRLLLVLEAILLTCLCILIIGVSVRLAALPAKRSSNPLPFNEQESTSRRYIGSTTCALPDRMLNSVAATSLTASSNAGSSRLGSSSAPIVGPTGPFDANVTCTPLQNVPAYDRILTWYGVQTDGPNTSGVVTIDMYTRNATQILNYMYQSPLNYTTRRGKLCTARRLCTHKQAVEKTDPSAPLQITAPTPTRRLPIICARRHQALLRAKSARGGTGNPKSVTARCPQMVRRRAQIP